MNRIIKSIMSKGIEIEEYKDIINLDEKLHISPIPMLAKIYIKNYNLKDDIIKIGDHVKEGVLLNKTLDFYIHSPISGFIEDIEVKNNDRIVTIKIDGEFVFSGKNIKDYSWFGLSPKVIVDIIKDKGVIYLSSKRKLIDDLNNALGKKIKHIIINNLEQEPMIYNNLACLKFFPSELIQGIKILYYLFNTDSRMSKITWAFQSDNVDFIPQIKEKLDFYNKQESKDNRNNAFLLEIEFILLKNKYPRAESHLLIDTLFNKKVHSKDMIKQGYFIIDVQTIYAIYEAVILQKPLIDRLITISGELVEYPQVLKAKIGTRIDRLLEESQGIKKIPDAMISSGLLNGHKINNLDETVDKNTNSVILLSNKQINNSPVQDCINCNICTENCPVNIDVLKLYKIINKNKNEKELIQNNIFDCIDCNVCNYYCPSRIDLSALIKENKDRIEENKIE